MAAMAVVAAGVSAYGQYSQAQSQKAAANYNAAVATNNATASAQQAQYDVGLITDQNARAVASQRAAMASSGFDANSGTFSDVTRDTKIQGEMNVLSRLYQGRVAATQSTSQAQLSTMQGNADMQAGYIGAGGTLLSGASSAFAAYENPNFH